MKIGLFGIEFYNNYLPYYKQIVERLEKENVRISVYKPLYESMKPHVKFNKKISVFNDYQDVRENVDVMFSIGGDGTILSSVTIVRDTLIPILGINLGNLGFLSSIGKDEIDTTITEVLHNNYILDKRTLIRLHTNERLFGDMNFALNEFAVHKKDNLSMIKVHVYVNDQFLNTYWADGLIVATPTGSTGYSLSCFGPIVAPGSENFIVTPISTHNLTVRPIVLPDDSIIKLKVSGRNKQFMGGLDSRYEVFNSASELTLSKCGFRVNLIQIASASFFNTIREKLNWGIDKRN